VIKASKCLIVEQLQISSFIRKLVAIYINDKKCNIRVSDILILFEKNGTDQVKEYYICSVYMGNACSQITIA
jgi:hypothetical protein